ncbi:NIPSNAP family protein [Pseudonocardia sp. WMMC193]|uniref:NIPSNAP family protein n=1 Tax=Pseudonocardia sp. WMMC193 TaxID=2911965 RepID=UPI001F268D61|nr:NIPSNAP family protein [Pseudonocardia sp. WMMC193]MCF7552356.1 NIPSNAP family protein [Pseudonocardia sp. WMMC193]
MIFEVREYVAVPGRLGAVVELFTSATVPLLAKHGMELVSAGRTLIGEHSWGELVYTLRFADLADLERRWGALLADPEWGAALAAAEADGPLFQTMRRRVLDAAPVTA